MFLCVKSFSAGNSRRTGEKLSIKILLHSLQIMQFDSTHCNPGYREIEAPGEALVFLEQKEQRESKETKERRE